MSHQIITVSINIQGGYEGSTLCNYFGFEYITHINIKTANLGWKGQQRHLAYTSALNWIPIHGLIHSRYALLHTQFLLYTAVWWQVKRAPAQARTRYANEDTRTQDGETKVPNKSLDFQPWGWGFPGSLSKLYWFDNFITYVIMPSVKFPMDLSI